MTNVSNAILFKEILDRLDKIEKTINERVKEEIYIKAPPRIVEVDFTSTNEDGTYKACVENMFTNDFEKYIRYDDYIKLEESYDDLYVFTYELLSRNPADHDMINYLVKRFG
jgi:hypothetical protein